MSVYMVPEVATVETCMHSCLRDYREYFGLSLVMMLLLWVKLVSWTLVFLLLFYTFHAVGIVWNSRRVVLLRKCTRSSIDKKVWGVNGWNLNFGLANPLLESSMNSKCTEEIFGLSCFNLNNGSLQEKEPLIYLFILLHLCCLRSQNKLNRTHRKLCRTPL